MTLERILGDPSASQWLKDALKTAYERDAVEAIHDARALLKLLGERYTRIVTRDFHHLDVKGDSKPHRKVSETLVELSW